MLRTLAMAGLAALALTACSYSTQTSSGADYLAGYAGYAGRAAAPDAGPAAAEQAKAANDLDAEIRQIAAIEPALRFPARIGVARVEGRQLTSVPPSELTYWGELAERLGPDTGEFAPVSPLIAAMVDPQGGARNASAADLIADIRRGAARQHLDYVLVYELSGNFSQSTNVLSAADLTILGYFLLPSREVNIRGAANAILLDVRNGYPYGTAAAAVEDTDLARGSSARDRGRDGAERAKLAAVEELTGEVEAMITDLRAAEAQMRRAGS
ncbi:MAG: hypothetical protein ACFE0P_13435 [Oceanicaulis sp.]